jgi:arginyl-tRNA--protein-N-Asp/Glu arginylyltransferase
MPIALPQLTQAPSCAYPAAAPPVSVAMTELPGRPCPYLPDRVMTIRGFAAGRMEPGLYHAFMDAGFRRNGRVFYQPICRGCRRCLPLRVPAGLFAPSRSQRRSAERNRDVKIQFGPPTFNDEKYDLCERYLRLRHGRDAVESRESMQEFWLSSPVTTLEFTYRDGSGRLLAIGICDMCAESLSSVYFYYEPTEAGRGLGTFGAMVELDFAATRGIPYYYLGYWIQECGAMEYKSRFRPCEVMCPDGMWRRPEDADANPDPTAEDAL